MGFSFPVLSIHNSETHGKTKQIPNRSIGTLLILSLKKQTYFNSKKLKKKLTTLQT